MESLTISERESESVSCASVSASTTLIENLRKCAREDTSILSKLTELKKVAPGTLYRDGQKGAPARGKVGEEVPFYEFHGLPAKTTPYDETKHKCPFECYMNGSGQLFHYGENECGDLLLTFEDEDGGVSGLFIIRKKEKVHAMPGGITEDSDPTAADTGLREFTEEVCDGISPSEYEELCKILLLGKPKLIKKDTMDDNRNTNWAFVTSTIMNIHFKGPGVKAIIEALRKFMRLNEKETLGAEICKITPEFIEKCVWSTHAKVIEAVRKYYTSN